MARNATIPRLLRRPDRSFFLFGPRGTGKSTWLQQELPGAFRFDLLDASLFLELSRDPHRLEALIGKRPAGAWVVLDEIHKEYPDLEPEDIRQALQYAASLAREEIHFFPEKRI